MIDKTSVVEYLGKYHVGKENAASSREMEQQFSVSGRTIRRIIHDLRRDGYPVCSDKDGYYYAASQSEINGTVSRLNEFVNGVSSASTGLLRSKIVPKQVQLTFTVSMDESTAKELGFRTFHTVEKQA